ncbi:MAG: hypothetical protein FJZ93_00665 [Chloroflexi bacterium]|nr:hypothetical protein [Chloroflexota bacterium]MBM4451004.1 hypothetical protein [Chloroflexota bacterium]
MVGMGQSKAARLSRGQSLRFFLYILALFLGTLAVHEAAHVLAVLALGVPVSELKFGFYGIHPSITLPEHLAGTQQAIVYYAGGLTTGIILLVLYLCYFRRRYRAAPSMFRWLLGLVTVIFAGMQLAMGYLEGCYHHVYVIGAGTLFSVTDIVVSGWAVSAALLHFVLCPWRKMKTGAVTGHRQSD